MKTCLIGFCVLMLVPFEMRAATFDETPPRVQAYIVRTLRQKTAFADIAVIHHRADEGFRVDENGVHSHLPWILGFQKSRVLCILKGDALAANSLVYLYKPFDWNWYSRSLHRKTPLYNPPLLHDGVIRLMFVTRQTEPLKDRRWTSLEFDPTIKALFRDDTLAMEEGRMSPQEYMEKHGLAAVFSNRVYRVEEGSTFQVDYPAPTMAPTSFELQEAELAKAREQSMQLGFLPRPVRLSAREASEIVFIAYLQDGKDGITRYVEVAKDDPFLVPMTEPKFQTELGKRFYAAITAPPGVETEPDDVYLYRPPEMNEAERLAWVPPPNTNSNGNVWTYLNPKKEVQTIEFFTDGEVRTGKDGKNTARFQWFKKDGVIEADSARWLESPDGQSIVQESIGFPDMSFLVRMWHRGRQPPPPDPEVVKAVAANGMRWEAGNGKTVYVFHPDGTCEEEGRPFVPKATWEPWYGRTICIRHTGGSVDPVLAYLSMDGMTLVRESNGCLNSIYRRRSAGEGGAKTEE